MSELVGADGKTPLKLEQEKIDYKAGGMKYTTPATPEQKLGEAFHGAQRLAFMQGYQEGYQAAKKNKDCTESHAQIQGQTQGQTAASQVKDPFHMEPCALATFMFLAREKDYIKSMFSQINDQLVKLGAEPLDLTHPYPDPEDRVADNDSDSDGATSEESDNQQRKDTTEQN